MCGVATFLQLQLNKHFGIGLPVMLGVAFQSVAPLIMIGKSHGSGAMFGALIISGIYVIFVSGVFSKFANLFPSIVTGSVITTIGLTLIPVAIGNMGNNVDKPTGTKPAQDYETGCGNHCSGKEHRKCGRYDAGHGTAFCI